MLIPLGFLGTGAQGTLELISTTVLAATATTVTLTLPAGASTTYKHLQLRTVTQVSTGGPDVQIRFNGDTGANYSYHILYGNGSAGNAANAVSGTVIGIGNAQATANMFTGSVVDILDAFNGNKNKTVRTLFGVSASPVGIWSGAWYSTSAVASITILNSTGVNFTVGSRFSLYGVRG